MRTLIVGLGALGGTIAARATCAGLPLWLAARSAESAAALRASGLEVSGIGGPAVARTIHVATVGEYAHSEGFELILLATKAHDALELAPSLARLLAPGGVVLPIQNGGVAQMLAERLGRGRVVGGLSNLGATMVEAGVYQQRNAGHLLIGELAGGPSERVERIAPEGRDRSSHDGQPAWCNLGQAGAQLFRDHDRSSRRMYHARVYGPDGWSGGFPASIR
jgi:2-dehydropantoate 2-reductase